MNVRTNKINDELLRKDVEQYPDDFQRERAVRFNCTQRAIGLALKRLQITQKKTLKHPKTKPEEIEQFLSLKQKYEQSHHPIVYIDESGFKNQTYRPYAYAPKGQTCHARYDWQIKNTSNAIGALYQNQLIAVGLYEFGINSDAFYSWVKDVLLPQLPQNSVLVMDNATFHKRQDIQDLIHSSGHVILWLPPYYPYLNLIEHTWAWLKHLRQDWRLNCIHSLFFYFTWLRDDF